MAGVLSASLIRRSRVGGNPVFIETEKWVPAFAGMTI